MEMKNLPKSIAALVGNRTFEIDDIGRSDSTVQVFDDMVLKIEKTSEAADREYAMMAWLDGKLPVPRVLAFAKENGYNYLLMTKLVGKMAFDSSFADKKEVARALAMGLKMLWSVDISACPVKNDLDSKLKRAKSRMEAGLLTHLPDGSKECLGFSDLPSLYTWLTKNRPEEDFVFSHGDYCLPNVFLSNKELVGFLDLGQAGIADRWSDITDCLWSMTYNFKELGGMSEEALLECKAVFFSTLGMEFDATKTKYYDLLNEFFA